MVTIGWVLRKKARQNKLSYLMGGKSLPWYLLGLSDASDMFDIVAPCGWLRSVLFME
jgi:Na+/proline symporter